MRPLAKISMGIGVILLIAKRKRLPKLPAIAAPAGLHLARNDSSGSPCTCRS
jgi:hypothetical protein